MKRSIIKLCNKKIIENILKQALNADTIIAHKNNHESAKTYINELY